MKKLLFSIVLLGITAFTLYLVWFCYLWYISMPIYHFTKEANSYTSNIYQADATLGHTLIPRTQGHYIWGYGDSISINTNQRGFRIDNNQPEKGGLLFLGDSFTLCEELDTEQAYPYQISDSLCQPAHNVAVSGYGYAQMILKAREYIKEVQPNAMVFQISPWLGERAATPYMPALFFKVPSPYYNSQGTIAKPYYTSEVFELTQGDLLDYYRQSEVSFGDRFGFVWHFTRKVFEKEYWESFKLWLRPEKPETLPTTVDHATQLAIDEVITLSKGRLLVLLVMGYEKEQVEAFKQSFADRLSNSVILINADEVLWTQPGINDKGSYEKAYCFWHGNPPVLVDYHFNAAANQLITNAVLQTLKPLLSKCAQ